MSGEGDEPPAAIGERQSGLAPISLLEAIRNEDKTWEQLAPRYGVTNPDPPWKVSLDATCECLAAGASLPALERRRAEDQLGEAVISSVWLGGHDQYFRLHDDIVTTDQMETVYPMEPVKMIK